MTMTLFPKLPQPPNAEDIQRQLPAISPLSEGVARPFWSVMIPTYNCAHYLQKTLASVLAQDPGSERMQIQVIDDCSTKDDPKAVVEKLGKGRVEFFRQPSNRGAIETFNTCIERACGQWVHILHGDDVVLPEFYAEYEATIEAVPDAVAVIGQAIHINENDEWMGLGKLLPHQDRRVLDFVRQNIFWNMVFAPGIVVRRSTYEKTGGFCPCFAHVADWDMWFRCGLVGSIGWVPQPKALYRIHEQSDTGKMLLTAKNIEECYLLGELNKIRMSPSMDLKKEHVAWRRSLANLGRQWSLKFSGMGLLQARLQHARWSMMLHCSWENWMHYLTSSIRAAFSQSRT